MVCSSVRPLNLYWSQRPAADASSVSCSGMLEFAAGGVTVARAAGAAGLGDVVERAVVVLRVGTDPVALLAHLQHAGEGHRAGRQVEQLAVAGEAVGLRVGLAVLGHVAPQAAPLFLAQRTSEARRIGIVDRVAVAFAELAAQVQVEDPGRRGVAGSAVAAVLGAGRGQFVFPGSIGDAVAVAEGAGPGHLAPLAVVAALAADLLGREQPVPALQVAAGGIDEVRRGEGRPAGIVLQVVEAEQQVGEQLAAVAQVPGAAGVAVVVFLLGL